MPAGDDGDDNWLSEPHEFDPSSVEPPLDDEAGPQVDIPTAPEPPEPSGGASTAAVARTFWIVVLMVNIGLFAVTAGLLYVLDRQRLQFGGMITVLGVAALLAAYRRYRLFTSS